MIDRNIETAQDAVSFLKSLGMRVEGDPATGPVTVFDLRGSQIEILGTCEADGLIDLATQEKAAIEASDDFAVYRTSEGDDMYIKEGTPGDEPERNDDADGQSECSGLSMTEMLENGWEIGRGSLLEVDEGSVDWVVEESEESDDNADEGGWGEGNSLNPGDEGGTFEEP